MNHEALLRLQVKLGNLNSALCRSYHKDLVSRLQALQAYETQCLKPLETLQLLINDLTRAPHSPELDFQLVSPFHSLKVVYDHTLEQFALLNTIEGYIRIDNASGLTDWLKNSEPRLLDTFPRQLPYFLSGILSLSALSGAWECAKILGLNEVLLEKATVDHNFLINLIKDFAWSTEHEDRNITEDRPKQGIDKTLQDKKAKAFARILKSFGPQNPRILWSGDTNGRTPLHYVGIYGLATICQSILGFLHGQQGDASAERKAILMVDNEGFTPLHWSIFHGHIGTTQKLLAVFDTDVSSVNATRYKYLRRTLNELFLVALKHKDSAMIDVLLASGHIDMSYLSNTGETALYVAAETGCEDFVKMMLEAGSRQGVDIDIRENFHGWTPLFVACVRGFYSVAELLLQAGACEDLTDVTGWTPKAHAVFRGHFPIAELCGATKATEAMSIPAQLPFMARITQKYHLQVGCTYILVNLGVLQDGRQTESVSLYKDSVQELGRAHADARLSLEISTSVGSHTSHLIRLPLLDDPIDNSIILPIDELFNTGLNFRLFSASVSSTGELSSTLVGSGIFLLQDDCKYFGARRDTLIREHRVPILGTEAMKLLGTVTFSYIVAKPFPHLIVPNPSLDTMNKPDSK